MHKLTNFPMSRRGVLRAGLAGMSALAMPSVLRASGEPLKIGVYGGYFRESFDKHIFPDFTKATGIAVESVAEPASEVWVVQMEQAARAGQVSADVSMIAQVAMLMGQETNLWAPLDLKKIPNSGNLIERFINKYPDGRINGLGAVGWYITLVTNTAVYKEAPTSWAAFWDRGNADKLGLLALVNNSFLLEITAKTFFGGTGVLDTEEGIGKVFAKLKEAVPNVRLWYRDEAQFQQLLKSGEIPMGQYYHDVTGLAVADGFPVRSTFPKEGGVQDFGSWAVSRASGKQEEAHIFIDYMCQPNIQATLARKVGSAPTVKRNLTDLSDTEFAAVSSDIDPIIPRYDLYQSKTDWLNQRWTELIAG